MADLQQHAGGARDIATDGAEALRSNGFRVTPQRAAILEFLDRDRRHHTPQAVLAGLEGTVESLSLATVYNTLELFCELGVLQRFTDEEGQSIFDPNLEPHHHARCDECGGLVDLNVAPGTVDGLIAASEVAQDGHGAFRVREATIWFRGACAECRGSIH